MKKEIKGNHISVKLSVLNSPLTILRFDIAGSHESCLQLSEELSCRRQEWFRLVPEDKKQ